MGINNEAVSRELPRYKCHKEVRALKIARIEFDAEKAAAERRATDGSAVIFPADEGYGPILVDFHYVHKHSPEVGGYFVVYDDGYTSFSPEEVFLLGYTRVG